MDKIEKENLKRAQRLEKKKIKRKKKNARVICRDGKEFWTTQDQFWQWVRERVVIKAGDNPLSGKFLRLNQEYDVVICKTVLNLACPNHLREALDSRRFRMS